MYNIFLQATPTIGDLSQQVQDIARTQQEVGASTINSAAFVVIALFLILCFGAIFGFLIKSMLNQQKKLMEKILNSEQMLEKFQISFDRNTEVLQNVNNYLQKIEYLSTEEARQEATSTQLHYFIKEALSSYKCKILETVVKLVKENGNVSEEQIEKNIDRAIKNIYKSFFLACNSFVYKGNRVGDSIMVETNDWTETQKNICLEFAKMANKEEYSYLYLDKLHSQLDLLMEGYLQEIKQKMQF